MKRLAVVKLNDLQGYTDLLRNGFGVLAASRAGRLEDSPKSDSAQICECCGQGTCGPKCFLGSRGILRQAVSPITNHTGWSCPELLPANEVRIPGLPQTGSCENQGRNIHD
jgi:hypothetical protein